MDAEKVRYGYGGEGKASEQSSAARKYKPEKQVRLGFGQEFTPNEEGRDVKTSLSVHLR